jgi:hypothetical protein
MRWFRRTPAEQPVALDPGRQEAILQEVRHRFGPAAQVRYAEQVQALVPALASDDGLMVATRIGRQVAEEAYVSVRAQVSARGYPVDRRNYRALWRTVGPALRTPLFGLPCGLHPYIHVAGSVAVIGAHATRYVKLTDPAPALAALLEVLDLTTAGWEFGRIPADADGAQLVSGLISTISQVRVALEDPPPLPPGIRELMRRNNTTPVYDPSGRHVIAGINVGAELRPAFLA